MNERLRTLAAQGYRLTSGEMAVSPKIDRELTAGAPYGVSINARILGTSGISVRIAGWCNTQPDGQNRRDLDLSGVEPATRELEITPVLLSSLPDDLEIKVRPQELPHLHAGDCQLWLHFTNDTESRLTWQAQVNPQACGLGWTAPLAAGFKADTQHEHESFALAASR